jgi:hypothetical protein
MADDPGLLPEIFDKANVTAQLDLCFHDAELDSGLASAACYHDAHRIFRFYEENRGVKHLVAQCQAGIGRSVAVCKSLTEIAGGDFVSHTHNRTLYKGILIAAGREVPREPLVSIAVRVKYDIERLHLFLLSMRRQRYTNWEVIAFTDGPNREAIELVSKFAEGVRIVETPAPKGRWGHPYRQMAFEHCQGEWIGTQNDDNYLTPGFLEQLVDAGERSGAGVVLCQPLHRYSAWQPTAPGSDLCCWIARRELVRQHRWDGDGFTADRDYLQKLMDTDGVRTVAVQRPLVVKN